MASDFAYSLYGSIYLFKIFITTTQVIQGFTGTALVPLVAQGAQTAWCEFKLIHIIHAIYILSNAFINN